MYLPNDLNFVMSTEVSLSLLASLQAPTTFNFQQQ